MIQIKANLPTIAKALITFYQVDHTYDRSFVIKYLTDLQTLLKNLTRKNLTEKLVGRVEQIFVVVNSLDFLDSVYVPKKNMEMRDIIGKEDQISDKNASFYFL